MATQVRSWRAEGGGGGGGALSQLINKDRSGHCHTEGNPGNDIAEMRTRDLLGGSLHKEIDLDVEPPPPLLSLSRWEKRLDMKSGKVYFHNANSTDSVQDLNFPPTSPLRERGNRLTSASADGSGSIPFEERDFMGGGGGRGRGEAGPSLHVELTLCESHEWQSVCTLDKVKTALQRAHKQSSKRKQGEEMLQCHSRSPSPSLSPSPLPSSSSCSSLVVSLPKQSESGEEAISTSLLAAGCPRCLMYVLLPKCDPKCPRCGCGCVIHNTHSSSSSGPKKPRLYHIEPGQGESVTVTDGSNHTPSPFLFDLNTPS